MQGDGGTVLRSSPKNVSASIADSIMTAALSGGDWTDVCAQIVDIFPGSYAALLNQSHVRKEFDFNVSAGIDEEHLQSFLEHYAFVNPWTRFWKGARSGAILVAERDDPARQYQHTEFYKGLRGHFYINTR